MNEALTACAKGKAPDAFLFTWPDGSRIKDFRGAWTKATKAAGVPDLIFHDLRRSAVRRMKRKGVPTSTAMLITGHLTRMVFDNYDAANAEDVASAAESAVAGVLATRHLLLPFGLQALRGAITAVGVSTLDQCVGHLAVTREPQRLDVRERSSGKALRSLPVIPRLL